MTDFNDPSSWLVSFLHQRLLFTALSDVWDVLSSFHLLLGWFANIAFIRTEMLFSIPARSHDSSIKNIGKRFHIMPICSGYDDRQRETMTFDEEIPFAPIFSPGRSD